MPRHQPWRISSPTRRAVPMLEYLEGRSLLAVTMGALPAAIASPSPGSAQAEAVVATMTAGAAQAIQPVTFSDGVAILGVDPLSQGMGVVQVPSSTGGSGEKTRPFERDPAEPAAGATPGWAAISEATAQALADIEIIGGSSLGNPAPAALKFTIRATDDGRDVIPDDRDNPTAEAANEPSPTETQAPQPDDGRDQGDALGDPNARPAHDQGDALGDPNARPAHDQDDAPAKRRESIDAATSEENNRSAPTNHAVRHGAAEQWDRFMHRPRTDIPPRSGWSRVQGRAIRLPSRPAGHRPAAPKPAQSTDAAATSNSAGS